ncbi:MAG: hydantoinase B/oxoprolinase family protein [Chloroflexi bacterium]|nr:hydantoinase B/oxoprolinase family protein [Chloroflexota bacterium]
METGKVDPITLEVVRESLISLCRGMGMAMSRTAYSPIFSEGFDFSCALFDGTAEMVAQAEFNPVHLGAMPYAVEWSLKEIGLENLEPGDVVMHNDPFRGGTHITDFTIMLPVFVDGEIVAVPANRAHQIDVGGMAPGGFPGSATEIFQEGIRLPPVKVFSRGQEVKDVWKILLSNVRVPREIQGDMRAMFGSLKVAERRILQLVDRYGLDTFKRCQEEIKNYSERRMRGEIAKLPQGRYEFEDYMDDDGIRKEPYKIKVAITVKGTDLIVDFEGSSEQARGAINATFGVCASQAYSVVLQVTDPHIPSNHGCFRPIKLIAPAGTVVNADFPAAVFGGNVEVSTRIVDVMLGAMAQAVPDRVVASCYGTCHNFTCGAQHHETGETGIFYLYQEGGWGARKEADGNWAMISPIGNDHNQPVEIFESKYPWLYEAYELVSDSGGPGRRRGGLGVRYLMRLLAGEARLNLLADRYRRSPYGLFGGLPPKPNQCGHWNDFRIKLKGTNEYLHTTELFGTLVPSKFAVKVIHEGDIVDYATTGGGGYGEPLERELEMVVEDVRNEYVSVESAWEYYGAVIDPVTLELNRESSLREREKRRG